MADRPVTHTGKDHDGDITKEGKSMARKLSVCYDRALVGQRIQDYGGQMTIQRLQDISII